MGSNPTKHPNLKTMKALDKYLEEEFRIKPLGKLTTEVYESEIGSYVGEEMIIDGKHTGIIVYYIDYINWLEK